MDPKKASMLRWTFRVGLAIEVLCLVWLWNASHARGGGWAALLIVFPPMIGLVTAAIGSFAKNPRSGGAIFSLLVHTFFFMVVGGFVGWNQGLKPWLEHQAYTRQDKRNAEHARLRKQLRAFVEAGRYEQAKAFLREDHPLWVGTYPPWSTALCPPDSKAPDSELLRLMGQRGAPKGGDLLMAASKCSLPAVKAVLKLGVAPTAVSKRGRTGLMTAWQLDILTFFLDHGVKVNARTRTGATAIMFHRSPMVTQFLLDHGADPKAVDQAGRSALHYKGPFEYLAACYEILLKAGVDPNQRNGLEEQYTPLIAMEMDHWGDNAGWYWDQDSADLLVKYGADPLARNSLGESALYRRINSYEEFVSSLDWPNLDLAGKGGAHLLMAALRQGNFTALDQLLEAGANPGAADFDGVVPLEYYESSFRTETPPNSTHQALLDAAARFR